jgi:hypothetical protein
MSKNPDYIFVKTCYERQTAGARTKKIEKKVRVRAIGGQEYNGKNLNVTFNFACSREVRDPEVNPIGTIFGFPSFNMNTSKSNFYRVNGNDLTVVDTEDPSSAMDNFYQKVYPYMVNEERSLKLADILSEDDFPLI